MNGIISLNEASRVYSSLPAELQLPSLCPKYVEVDSLRDVRLKPYFWHYSNSSFNCLRSFHVVASNFENGKIVRDIEYPYGYGGVLCSPKDASQFTEAHNSFCRWAEQENIVVEFCRIHPLLTCQKNFFVNQHKNRDVVRINLASDFFFDYRKKRRWTIRKELKKDLELICAPKNNYNLMLFKSLYLETMARVGASEFYYFNDQYFERLFQLDGVRLWFLLYQNRPLSAAILLESNAAGIIEYHLGAYTASSKDQPVETLLHLIAKYYAERKFKWFYLGGGRSSKQDDSLLSFKKGFSKDILDFSIGYNIINEAKYNELKAIPSTLSNPNRIIFYRD